MKHLLAIILFLFACGGYDLEVLDLGADAQPMTAQINGFGVRMDGASSGVRGKACTSGGGTSQKCLLPSSKSITYRFNTAGVNSADQTSVNGSISTSVSRITSQLSGWSLTAGTIGPTLLIRKGTVENDPGATDIRTYARLNCVLEGSALTESPASDGTYRVCTQWSLDVDFDKIVGAFGAAGRHNAIEQAVGGFFYGAGVGLGYQTSDTSKVTSTSVNGSAKSFGISAVNVCRVNAFATAGAGSVTLQNTCF